MMDLEIWLDLAVGIIALGAIGFGIWVYLSSESGKEISIPFLKNGFPTPKLKQEKLSPQNVSKSINKLLGRESISHPEYEVPEDPSLTVPIKSTTLPSNRTVPALEELYDRAQAFDEAEKKEVKPVESTNESIFYALTPQKTEEISPVEAEQIGEVKEEPVSSEPLLTQSILDRINGKNKEESIEKPVEIAQPEQVEEMKSQPVVEEPAVIPEIKEAKPVVEEKPIITETKTRVQPEVKVPPQIQPKPEPKKVEPKVQPTPRKTVQETVSKNKQPIHKKSEEAVSGLPTLQRAESGVPFAFAQFLLLIQNSVQKTVHQAKEKISQAQNAAKKSSAFKPKPAAEYEAGKKKITGVKSRFQAIFQSLTSIFKKGVEKVQEKADIPGRIKVEDDMVEVAAQTTRNGRTPYLNFFKIDKVPVKENCILLGLQNVGWSLTYEKFETGEHNQVPLDYRSPQRYSSSPSTYSQGSLICFEIDNKGKADFIYHFIVFFKDRNGVHYSQEVYGHGVSSPLIKDPEILAEEEVVAESVS